MVAALAMGLTPVLAAETSLPSGSPDTSGGATEQSSSAGSTTGKMGEQSSSPPSTSVRLSKPPRIRQHQVLATRFLYETMGPLCATLAIQGGLR
jgi:hypothetical protein